MKYKAYVQEPHAVLTEIKKAFEEEKSYKAQSICLSYFAQLDNQKYIEKALDYASKDEVYQYVTTHMRAKAEYGPAVGPNPEWYIESFKAKTEMAEKQAKEFEEAKSVLEQFCTDNNLDLNAMVEQYSKKMTKEELVEANKRVTERQEGKIVVSKDNVMRMPEGEEYMKLMVEAEKVNRENCQQKWSNN